MSSAEVFRRIVGHLDRHEIAYMLVGSFAATFFGASRTTLDIDIVIEATPDQLSGLVSDLQADDYYAELDTALDAQRHESMFNVIDPQPAGKST